MRLGPNIAIVGKTKETPEPKEKCEGINELQTSEEQWTRG
jgi:hypothetical protein